MRVFLALVGCVVIARGQSGLIGVWVLDQRHSQFANPGDCQKIVMRVEANLHGSMRVIQISTDAAGRQLQVGQRAIDSVSGRSHAQVVLRHEETGAAETWTLGRHGIEPEQQPCRNRTADCSHAGSFRPAEHQDAQ